MRVSQVNIKFGSHIDQIQLVLSDGIEKLELASHGGDGGGSVVQYKVPDGHRITKVEVWSGKGVSALRFTTDKGDMSKIFGQTYFDSNNVESVSLKVVTAPQNGHLIGLEGKSSKVINMIRFVWLISTH
jgi:hypothetical protein